MGFPSPNLIAIYVKSNEGDIRAYVAKKEPSEQRANSGESDRASGKVVRLEHGS